MCLPTSGRLQIWVGGVQVWVCNSEPWQNSHLQAWVAGLLRFDHNILILSKITYSHKDMNRTRLFKCHFGTLDFINCIYYPDKKKGGNPWSEKTYIWKYLKKKCLIDWRTKKVTVYLLWSWLMWMRPWMRFYLESTAISQSHCTWHIILIQCPIDFYH